MFIGKKTNQDKFFLKIQAKQTTKKWLTDAVSGFKLTVCIPIKCFQEKLGKIQRLPRSSGGLEKRLHSVDY